MLALGQWVVKSMSKSVRNPSRATRSLELPGGPDDERPLNERIKQFVLGEIDSGAWPEGYRVPSETELAKAFGTARMTVHGALHDLAATGILLRRPGAGTRVARRKPQSALLEIRNIHDEVVERGHRHSAKVHRLSAETCDLATATELELAPGSAVFHSIIVHFEDDRPIQIENRFVRPTFAPRYLDQDFTRATPYEHLMNLGPLDEVEHIIQSLIPDRATRALLKIPEGEPVLHIRRRTWSGGPVVSSARLIHPGSSYSLVGRLNVNRRATS
jgi:GntR family transcriptional regulator, histidine utilization repressor